MPQSRYPLYAKSIPNLQDLLEERVKFAIEKCQLKDIPTFIRADDIGVPSHNFTLLTELHKRHDIPLCLAVVPSWITKKRLENLYQCTGKSNSLFCWFQHGRKHRNYEKSGKKYEFGPSRTFQEVFNDLQKGKRRLEELLEDNFSPFFTPPWNRCSQETLDALVELGFKGISRSKASPPKALPPLTDLSINVDLHTRKEASQQEALHNLMEELVTSISTGVVGIMLHHQLMNKNSFVFMETLFKVLKKEARIRFCHFDDISISDYP